MTHTWEIVDDFTAFCSRCAVRKGDHGKECLATPNCYGMMHLLAKRKREGKTVALGTDPHLAPIIGEKFPPPESS